MFHFPWTDPFPILATFLHGHFSNLHIRYSNTMCHPSGNDFVDFALLTLLVSTLLAWFSPSLALNEMEWFRLLWFQPRFCSTFPHGISHLIIYAKIWLYPEIFRVSNSMKCKIFVHVIQYICVLLEGAVGTIVMWLWVNNGAEKT